MPAAIAWGVALLGAEIGSAVLIMYATEIATAAIILGGLAYSSAKAKQAKQQAKDAYNAAQVDRLASLPVANAPRDLVLGRVRKGGTIFYRASTGVNSQDLYMAIALAGHEIDAVEQIYLNDVPVTLDGSGYVTTDPYAMAQTLTGVQNTGAGYTVTLPATYVTGTATATIAVDLGDRGRTGDEAVSCSVVGLTATAGSAGAAVTYQYLSSPTTVKVTAHLGAAGQTVDADLLAAFPADWPSTTVVQGVAYLVVKMSYNETAFPSGAPNVSALVRGAKVYDPRTATTAWSDNPALLMRHVYQHAKFGKATVTAAEDTRITAAANVDDTSTVYTVDGVAQTACALYRAGVVAPFGTPAKSLLDDLAQSMGGSWAFAGGELYIKPGVYSAPVMALTDADLAVIQRNGATESQRPISISVHKERAQKFNTVKATIWDSGQDYKQSVLTPLVASGLVTRDGVELVQEVTFPAISYAPQALHIAGIMMRDARDALVVELPFKLRAYPLELFDVVSLTLARYGWSAKTFMILARSWTPDGTISLTLKETAAAITQMDADFLPQGFAANTNLPKPWEVASVGTLTITSGTTDLLRQADGTVVSRMRMAWTQIADAAVRQNGQIEVQYRQASSSGAWTVLTVPGDETQAITSDVQDSQIYVVRARAKTSTGVGDWCPQIIHFVVGKTSLPSNPAGFAHTAGETGIIFTWTACADPDYAHTIIKSGTVWASGTEIFKGATNRWVWPRPTSGTYSVMISHVDTSGHESATPQAITGIVYVLDPINNTAIVSGGKLVTANVVDTANITDAAATDIYQATPIAGPVTASISSGTLTQTIISTTFTPAAAGVLIVTGIYSAQQTRGSGWAVGGTGVVTNAFCTQSGSTDYGTAMPLDVTRVTQINHHSFTVAAGASVTVGLVGALAGDVAGSWWDMQCIAELIKK